MNYFTNVPSNETESSLISRRKSLKTVGTTLIPLNITRFSTKKKDDEWVTIDAIKHGEETVRTKEVPTKWHEQERRARRVHENLADNLLSAPSVVEISRANGSRVFKEKWNNSVINVYVDPEKKQKVSIPEKEME